MKQPEALFSQRVARDLSSLSPAWFERIQQQSIRGTPDRVGLISGRFVAIELKRSAGARVERLQEFKLGRIRDAGGVGLIVYPENWEEQFRFLQTLQYRKVENG